MDEARRFIRYVFPGLSTLFFIGLFLYVTNPNRASEFLEQVIADVASSIGAALAVFVASGAIGYLAGVAHHILDQSVYTRIPSFGWSDDWVTTIKNAVRRGELILIHPSKGRRDTADLENLRIQGAWLLFNAIWHFQKGHSKGLQLAEERTTALFDIRHGTGTLFVGSFFAVLSWLLIEAHFGWTCRTTVVLVLALATLAVLGYNFHLTARIGPRVTCMILSNYLAAQKEPVKVIADDDLFRSV